MSIFSSQVGTTPNRVEMFINFMRNNKKSLTKKDIKELFSPKEESTAFDNVFSFCNTFKLITIESDVVFFNGDNKKATKDIIFDAIFTNDVENDNFVNVVTWFTCLGKNDLFTYNDNVGGSGKIQNDTNQYINESLSPAPWQNLIYWLEYFGFATKLQVKNETIIIPDSTIAIKNKLNTLFQKDKTYAISDFFIKLSSLIPVLEYSKNKEKLYHHLREGLKITADTFFLSSSLALLKLEKTGCLELIAKPDSDVMILELRRVSHIKFLGLKD
jgi:hypothetical protein